MNPLAQIPPAARRIVYTIYGFVGLGLAAVQVGYSAGRLAEPLWLIIALAVFGFLGTGIGATAVTHVPNGPKRSAKGAIDLLYVAVLVLIVVVILVLLGVV